MKKARLSFYDEIKKNKRNSVLLIILVFLALILLSYVIGLAMGPDYFFIIMVFGIIFSTSYTLISYYNSDKIALASVSSKLLPNSGQFRQIHHILEGLCLASGMPKPKLYIMPGEQINAFATGRDPKNSVICLTRGAIQKLNKQELEGVISHELSHIANNDIKFMTLAAVLVGMVAIIAQFFLRSLWWSSLSGGRSRSDNGNAVFILIGILLAILAPIFTALVQLAISRQREYNADATAVKFTRSPTGLIKALTKIKHDSGKLKVSSAISPLFISNPSRTKEFFQTHPDVNKRIRRLERM
jgi:heat shock protein HtpX